MPEETTTTEETGGGITVVTELEEKPEVGHEGTIGSQPTDADLDTYAEARLRSRGFKIEREQQKQEGVISGTDIPTWMYSQDEWDSFTPNEQKVAQRSWSASQRTAQASAQHAQQLAAPMLRKTAIDQIAAGLDERTKPYLTKVIENMEAESGVPFAPEKVTKNMAELLQNAAVGMASKGPKASPTVGKEPPVTEGKLEATSEEQEIIDYVKKRSGKDWTVEQARKYASGKLLTQGYVTGAKN